MKLAFKGVSPEDRTRTTDPHSLDRTENTVCTIARGRCSLPMSHLPEQSMTERR